YISRKGGYKNRLLDDQTNDRTRCGAQRFSNANFAGTLFYHYHHNVAHAHYSGYNGTDTDYPHKYFYPTDYTYHFLHVFLSVPNAQSTFIIGVKSFSGSQVIHNPGFQSLTLIHTIIGIIGYNYPVQLFRIRTQRTLSHIYREVYIIFLIIATIIAIHAYYFKQHPVYTN